MLEPSLPDRSIQHYEAIVGSARIERVRELGESLDGTRILHVSSTATGGGVAELLRSIVPLCSDLGVDTTWLVMEAPEDFFGVTKSLHNGLQGEGSALREGLKATYRSVCAQNAASIDDDYDLVVLHDPQTIGMIDTLAERLSGAIAVWRCHLDLTDPSPEHLAFVAPYVERADHAIFSRSAYAEAFDHPSSSVVHPSIDPLAAKNRELDPSTETRECERLEPLSFDDPIVTQVSRFDPWKDQFGTLEAYRLVRSQFPDAQLVLVGGMADDDPEGVEVHDRVAAVAADEPNVYVLTDLPDTTVNHLQRRSDVVVQKSIREGFGLVVSEALWKRTPVVGSNVGGIPLQIVEGQTGFLVDPSDVQGLADRIERLLVDDERRAAFGRRGRDHVREGFLLPRQLEDYLEVFTDLVGRDS